METRRHLRLVRIALLVGVVLAVGSPASARAATVRVRWQPATTEAVGYHVYVRAAGTPYGAPIDVGLPGLGADGTLTAFVPAIIGTPASHIAVAAYTGDGTESPL